jgi:hypothetical protein
MAAFLQALALLGWKVGRNLRINIRWATADSAEIRRHAAELVALTPDVILATGDSTIDATGACRRGDRVRGILLHLLTAAPGTTRNC